VSRKDTKKRIRGKYKYSVALGGVREEEKKTGNKRGQEEKNGIWVTTR